MFQAFRKRQPPDERRSVGVTAEPITEGMVLDILPASELLGASLQQRLTGLRLESALQDGDYDRVMLGPVRACAEWVQQLPATRDGHHREACGLIRLAVECASVAMRRVDGKLLHTPGEGLGGGVEADTGWRLAAVLGGLFRAIGTGLGRWRVSSADGRRAWNPYEEGLGNWAGRIGARRYRLHSTDPASRITRVGAAAWVASRCLPPESLERLNRADDRVMGTLLDVLGGHRGSVLGEIVDDALRAVVTEDENRLLLHAPKRRPERQEQLLRVMRSLARRRWTFNDRAGRLLRGPDGVYLHWKHAAGDIREAWSDAHEDAPTLSAVALAGVLRGYGLVESNPAGRAGEPALFELKIRDDRGTEAGLACVRLPDPRIFALDLDGVEPLALREVPPGDGGPVAAMLARAQAPAGEAAEPAQEASSAADTGARQPRRLDKARAARDDSATRTPAGPADSGGGQAAGGVEPPVDAGACLPGLSRYGELGRALSALAAQDDAFMRVTDGVALRASALKGSLTLKRLMDMARPQGVLVSQRPRAGAADGTAPDELHVVFSDRMADALGVGPASAGDAKE